MPRQYVINGPVLVTVQNPVVGAGSELGISNAPISVAPNLFHQDIHTDDYADRVPPDTFWLGADVTIEMTLVHFNPEVLYLCLEESMCGSAGGTLKGFGQLMGRGRALQSDGNHYIQLTLSSPDLNQPWVFPAAYMAVRPLVLPLGVERSLAVLTWRAIPYVQHSPGQDIVSEGAVLYSE